MNRPGLRSRLASRIHRQEHGQMIVFAALIIVIVVGMGALAVDVGFFVHERENVQYAVDAGALAGAALLPDNGTGAATAAQNFTLANDGGLSASNVSVSFRCLVGNVSTDVPSSCNPGADASWTTTSTGLQVSPCVPASGDKCNVIVVSASNSVKFFLSPVLHIKQGNTGSITSAACSGACGAPPTIPVDLAVIMDRTGSMSSSDLTNAKNAAKALLQTYNPAIQYVALGTLGPSQQTSSCGSPNSPAKVLGASSAQYDETTIAKWVPIGLTGIGAPAPFNEAYLNPDGTLNTNSTIVKGINCLNTSSTGTNLATPMKKAKEYLLANGRSGVKKGIVFETDGEPNYGTGTASNYTCAQSSAEATAAKAAGIEVFTIAFGLTSTTNCPDTSGFWHNKPATNVLADMATQPSVDNGCFTQAAADAENADGDHFFCQPKTAQLASIFRTVASAASGSTRLVSVP